MKSPTPRFAMVHTSSPRYEISSLAGFHQDMPAMPLLDG